MKNSFLNQKLSALLSSMAVFFLLGFGQNLSAQVLGDVDMCWADSYGRGAGKIPTKCAAGEEYENGLCYKLCQTGYTGEGPVCWQNCPAGYRDDGAFCAKPEAYGRGAGYPWKFGDPVGDYEPARKRCVADNPQGCEKDGLIWYPKCRTGFTKVGCCICSPKCPTGMTDIGVSCTKKSYGRGEGTIPKNCDAGTRYENGLCYKSCNAGYTGIGPVCWAKCPSVYPYTCGMGCTKNSSDCASSITNQVTSTLEMVANITGLVLTAGTSTAGSTVAKASIKASIKSSAQALGKELAESTLENAAGMFYEAQFSGEFSWEDLDPTGIANVVKAFNKPLCKDIR